jgi:iron complex transport system ATP-binding protein
MSSIIEVNNLCWNVNGKSILNDISFTIPTGQFVGVIGTNGSGKTSLLRSLYRFTKPSSGSVLLNGHNIWQQSAINVAKQIAVVSQSNTATPYKAIDVVAMGLIPHKALFEGPNKQDKALIDNALTQLDLSSLKNNDFETLSGGEQQRVLIARAIVQQGHNRDASQQLLIMDEPTNHLDVHYQLDLLQRVKNLGISVIVSLHDLNIASAFCDQLLLIDNGKIIRQGTPQQVLEPELISRIYNVDVSVIEHPTHQRPHLLFSYGANHE